MAGADLAELPVVRLGGPPAGQGAARLAVEPLRRPRGHLPSVVPLRLLQIEPRIAQIDPGIATHARVWHRKLPPARQLARHGQGQAALETSVGLSARDLVHRPETSPIVQRQVIGPVSATGPSALEGANARASAIALNAQGEAIGLALAPGLNDLVVASAPALATVQSVPRGEFALSGLALATDPESAIGQINPALAIARSDPVAACGRTDRAVATDPEPAIAPTDRESAIGPIAPASGIDRASGIDPSGIVRAATALGIGMSNVPFRPVPPMAAGKMVAGMAGATISIEAGTAAAGR